MAVAPKTLRVIESSLGVTVCAIGIVIALTTLNRGAWYDEFITVAWTLQGTSVHDFLALMIALEPHPILHYGLIYLGQTFGLSDIPLLRSLNIFGVILVFCIIAYVYRLKAISSSQAVILLALFTSSSIFTEYLAELRGYFLLYSASISVGLLWCVLMQLIETGSSPPRSMIAIWGLCLAIYVNLHYFATILGGLLTITLLFSLAVRRFLRPMFALASVSVIAASPAIILWTLQVFSTPAGQMSDWIFNRARSWIETDFRGSIITIFRMARWAVADNFVVAASAVTACLLLLENGKKWHEAKNVMILFAVITFFLSGLVALNAVIPCIIDRYLIAAAGAVTVAVGLLAASPGTPAWVPTTACMVALVLQAHTFSATWRSEQGWDTSAKAVAEFKAQCPTTRILVPAYNHMKALRTDDISLGLRVNTVSYGYYAKKLHFSYEDLLPGAIVAAGDSCPSIVWIEQISFFWRFFRTTPPLDFLLNELQIQVSGEVQSTEYGSGLLLIVRPRAQ
jgi:hypothetical protein